MPEAHIEQEAVQKVDEETAREISPEELEIKKLNTLVQGASYQMRDKLILKVGQGYSGWDDMSTGAVDGLVKAKLRANMECEDWVDVMNCAAILYYRDVQRRKTEKDTSER